MSGVARRGAARAEQRIPEAEHRAVVAVRVGAPGVMVHPVDRRGDDQAAERPLQRRREPGVGVVEDGGHQHEALEQHHRGQRDVQEHDHPGPCQGGQRDLAEMEADRARGVEQLVIVVHGMEAPQERDLVVGAVPPVDPQVQQQQIEDERPGAGEDGGAQAQRERVGPGGQRQDQERRQQQVEAEQAEIAPEAAPRGGRGTPEADQQRARHRRAQPLPHGEDQGREGDQRRLQSDQGGDIHPVASAAKIFALGPSCTPQALSQIPLQTAEVGIASDTAPAS